MVFTIQTYLNFIIKWIIFLNLFHVCLLNVNLENLNIVLGKQKHVGLATDVEIFAVPDYNHPGLHLNISWRNPPGNSPF